MIKKNALKMCFNQSNTFGKDSRNKFFFLTTVTFYKKGFNNRRFFYENNQYKYFLKDVIIEEKLNTLRMHDAFLQQNH